MPLLRLQHASVPRPSGEEAHQRAVDFYTGVLGLEHIPKPRTFADRIEVTWFRVGDDEVHVYAAGPDEPAPDTGAHFCLAVDNLKGTRERLKDAGYRCEDAFPIPNRPRFYTYDPFGNRIEITAIEGDYLAG